MRVVVSLRNALHGTLGRRLALGVTVGLAAYLLFQLVRIAAEASGLCTGCNADGAADVLGAASVGGASAAYGGADDPPGRSRFDDWLDKLLGSGRPPPSVEAVDPPPPDPAAEQAAADEARRMNDLYKHLIGTKGVVDMPDGSVGGELNKAMDRVLDFSTGQTDVGPAPPGDGDGD